MNLVNILKDNTGLYHSVVPFNPGADKLHPFNLTASNMDLTPELLADTSAFSTYIEQQLTLSGSRYGIGGYDEHRTIYARSAHFSTEEEPRRLHLGVDIWGAAGTPVYAPLAGNIHSFQFNDQFGDYGATIILRHQLEGIVFHTLYGHLNLESLTHLKEKQPVETGQPLALFGLPEENGHWPPHLHFQIVIDMEGYRGDYPGVCKFSERTRYLTNCPDPNLILQLSF